MYQNVPLLRPCCAKYHYTNEEVVDTAIEWINTFVSDIKGTPWLLFENLWHSGLTMLDPELTSRILEEVNYKYKGVMLDIGHLLHTNPQLSNLDEAILYIEQVLDLYDDLDFIKGVHLHQTLSGSYSLNLKIHGNLVLNLMRQDYLNLYYMFIKLIHTNHLF